MPLSWGNGGALFSGAISMMVTPQAAPPPESAHGIAFRTALGVWARVAALSFGGPAGQIAVMHRILVDEKRWIGERRFLHALNYCMLLPGPEAQQLSIYIGWLLHGLRGGLAAGVLFILPGVIALMALSWCYVAFGTVPVVQAIFLGLKAAVIAVVIEAVLRIGRRALKTTFTVIVAMTAFAAIYFMRVPFPAIVATAALAGFVAHRIRPAPATATSPHEAGTDGLDGAIDRAFARGLPAHVLPNAKRAVTVFSVIVALWLGPVVLLDASMGNDSVFTQIGSFFARVAVVTFGGAYAILAYVAQEAVNHYGWLRPGEMLDGLGMAETTPGPLIMVLQFVGFMGAFRQPGALSPMLAGTLGGLLTTWTTFTPCFLWIFLGGPYFETLRTRAWINAALSAVTAAIVGVILNLAIWFALHVMFAKLHDVHIAAMAFLVPDMTTLQIVPAGLTLIAVIALFGLRLGMIWTFALCAATSAGLYALRHFA